MATIDRGVQERVWERVRGTETAGPPQPAAALLEEQTEAAILERLPPNRLVERALEQTLRRIQLLRGLCILCDQPIPGPIPPPGQTNRPLRTCLAGLLRRRQEYEQLAGHREFGVLYRALEGSAGESCVFLTRQLGNTPLRNLKR